MIIFSFYKDHLGTEEQLRASKVLVMFYFLTRILVTWICSFCENLLSYTYNLSTSYMYIILNLVKLWRKGVRTEQVLTWGSSLSKR